MYPAFRSWHAHPQNPILVVPPLRPIERGAKAIKEDNMPKFLIERNMPGVGSLSTADLKGASQKSCSVLHEIGPDVQWIHSYVTNDKIYCIYQASDEALVHKHAQMAGFPADQVSQVHTIIDPTTAE